MKSPILSGAPAHNHGGKEMDSFWIVKILNENEPSIDTSHIRATHRLPVELVGARRHGLPLILRILFVGNRMYDLP